MELILVRHGHPQVVRDAEGIADPDLSELGRWQAQRLGDWLAHERIDHVITSPKRRAIATAAPLVERLGLSAEVIADLDEIDRRSRTYLPTELLVSDGGEYFAAMQEQRWADIGWDEPAAFETRVLGAFAEIVSRRPGERVVIASHGGVMNRWLREIYQPVAVGGFGGRADRASFNIPYAAITRVQVGGDGFARVVSLNETGHFDASREAVRGPMADGTTYRGIG